MSVWFNNVSAIFLADQFKKIMLIKKIRVKFEFYKGMIKNMPLYFNTSVSRAICNNNMPYAICFLDRILMNRAQGRFSYIFFKYLEAAGLKLFIKTEPYYYAEIKRYKKMLLNEVRKFTLIRHTSAPANSILIYKNNQKKVISIKYGYGIQKKEALDCILPFPMHPLQVAAFSAEKVKMYRGTSRSVKIFFSGNVDASRYSVKRLLDKYNVITRHELFLFLKAKYSHTGILKIIDDRNALYNFFGGENEKESIVLSQAKTDPKDWFRFLGKSDFFFSPPGVAYPWCHNSIEAMAVGAIPILQYSNLFFPNLQHMENCLCFSNYEDLNTVLEQALTMETREVERMRKNVIRYFDEYLSPSSIVKNINEFISSEETEMVIGIPYINPVA